MGGFSSRNNINIHAANLLADLRSSRSADIRRPIIFVAHSLGGIVVKDALRKARESVGMSQYRSIFEATHSIVFLGTPHNGSSYARFGRLVASILRWFWRDTNVSLVRSLEIDSDILDRVSEDFRYTLLRRRIKICSFIEELSTPFLLNPIVLPRSGYSGVEGEIQRSIHANHRDMCRFNSEDDVGYTRIADVITEFVADVTEGSILSSLPFPPRTTKREILATAVSRSRSNSV